MESTRHHTFSIFQPSSTAPGIRPADYGRSRVGVMKPEGVFLPENANTPNHNVDVAGTEHENVYVRRVERKSYELTDHLGNVRVVLSDVKTTTEADGTGKPQGPYKATLLAANNYYPFGMLQPGRHWSTGEYRYGYNGMEKDDEVKGEGNSYTTYYRGNDPRLGRWLSLDPKATAWESPYTSMGNNPILYIDPMGDEFFTNANQETIDDIKSVAGRYSDILKFNAAGIVMKVSIDFDQLRSDPRFQDGSGNFSQPLLDAYKTQAMSDQGVKLLDNLINDQNNMYYYSASATIEFEYMIDGDIAWQYYREDRSQPSGTRKTDMSWFVNLSITRRGRGAYGDPQVPDPQNPSQMLTMYMRPVDGYQGAVYIAPGRIYGTNLFGRKPALINRASYVYHELLENYYRTNGSLEWTPAHLRTQQAEGSHFGNGSPGEFEYFEYP